MHGVASYHGVRILGAGATRLLQLLPELGRTLTSMLYLLAPQQSTLGPRLRCRSARTRRSSLTSSSKGMWKSMVSLHEFAQEFFLASLPGRRVLRSQPC